MTSKSVRTGCVMLFALPFAGIGLICVRMVIAAIRRGEPGRVIFILACVAVAFCLVGFGLILGAFFTGRRVTQDDTLRAQHPDSPWMWRPDWASRRIGDETSSTLFNLWAFAILWNTFAVPSLLFIHPEWENGHPAVLLVLLFPLAGLLFLSSAVRLTLRAIRFRRSTLILDTMPAPVGGTLRGHVHVPYPALTRASRIFASLTTTVTEGSGKSTTTSIAWQDEIEIVPASLGQTAEGVTIPIAIDIPSDASPTEGEGSNKREWRLTVDAEVPGVDYSATFEVPVFRTAFSDVRPPRTLHTPIAEPRHPQDCTVQHTAHGLEVYFPPFRAKSIALTAFAVGLVFAFAVYVTSRIDVPLIFPIVCGLMALVMLWTTIDLLFGSRTVVVSPREVTLRKRTLFWEKEKRIDRDEIASVDLAIETQQTTGRLQPYYEVVVRPTAGRRVSAAKYIRSKREAEWLAAQMRRR